MIFFTMYFQQMLALYELPHSILRETHFTDEESLKTLR